MVSRPGFQQPLTPDPVKQPQPTQLSPPLSPPVRVSVGERNVYMCRSERFPRVEYRVDLTACNGFSQCSCLDWAMRRFPAIQAKKAQGTRETACKHVLAARVQFTNEILSELARIEEGKQ